MDFLTNHIEAIIAILTALTGAFLSIRKGFQNQKLSEDDKKSFYVETIILTLSLTYLALDIKTSELESGFEELKKEINHTHEIEIIKNPDWRDIIDAMTEDLASLDEGNSFNGGIDILYSRTQFWPGPVIGKGVREDRTLYNNLKVGGFELRYFLGFPDIEEAQKFGFEKRRFKMNKYSFDLLTNKLWWDDDIEYNAKKSVSFYYLPSEEDHASSWVMKSRSKANGGLIFPTGTWEGKSGHPVPHEMLRIAHDYTAKFIFSLHNGYVSWSERVIRQELKKPYYEREPIMVFISEDQSSLEPKTLEEIIGKKNEYFKHWALDNGPSVDIPQPLKELDEILQKIEEDRL